MSACVFYSFFSYLFLSRNRIVIFFIRIGSPYEKKRHQNIIIFPFRFNHFVSSILSFPTEGNSTAFFSTQLTAEQMMTLYRCVNWTFFSTLAVFIFLFNEIHFFFCYFLVVLLMFPNVYMVLIISRCKFPMLWATYFTSFGIRWNCLGNGNVEKNGNNGDRKFHLGWSWNGIFSGRKKWTKYSGCLGMNNERETV